MAQSDTEMVRQYLDLHDGEPQATVGERIGVDQRTVSDWQAKLDKGQEVHVRKGETRRLIEDELLAGRAHAKDFRDGVTLAITEARKALDELERRLTIKKAPVRPVHGNKRR